MESPVRDDAIARAERFSPFLNNLMSRHPKLTALFREQGADAALATALGGIAPDLPAGTRLRRMKQVVALVTALADLAGEWPLEKVVTTLSDFADLALDEAIAAAIRERAPDADPHGLALIALGKHGSRELNYSSDVDPMVIYDPEGLPLRPREEPADAAVRITRRVIELMQSRDADGYVFRMDLRLRPHPEATPIALPVEAVISYYESAALPWERAAFIRSRAAAGDKALGQSFLKAIQPFIWRRSLDFGAVGDIQDISRRIRDHHAQGQKFGPGWDLKKGRGGIREVEFHAQILQMIYGGREPVLRAPATLDALRALADAGRLDIEMADDLAAAYRLYRTIEHRLQMVDDQQTHMLPRDAAALDRAAQLHGLDDGAALLDLLRPHVERTGRYYDGLVAEPDEGKLPADEQSLQNWLGEAGFADPEATAAKVLGWRSYKARALRSPSARRAFEAILPPFLTGIGGSPNPASALQHFDRFLERLPSGAQFFTLLEANPKLVQLLVRLLGYAPTLADGLSARPDLIDGLIDASAFEPVPAVLPLARELARGTSRDDYEALLDAVRNRVAERRFALGVHLVEGLFDPLEIASGHSRLAEASIHALAEAATAEFEATHGTVPGGRLIILGLGRLGGGALTPASDLDLIFLFSGHYDTQSNGRKPLGATAYFNRLAQRVVAALSVPTARGPLYEVDTRLRPSGAQGLLAVSIDSFAKYQRESAWTWEHMALTRARVLCGTDEDRNAVDRVIAGTLGQERDLAQLRADVVKMRGDMALHKKPSGTLDVKLLPGGLVDLEFVVHYHQLKARTAFDPRLPQAIIGLVSAGLVAPGLGEAHDLLTRLLICCRFLASGMAEPEDVPDSAAMLIARACGFESWDATLAAYEKARQCVTTHWDKIAKGTSA
jgi:glutamate-ammonia-ligase adenylyltransferase